MAALRASLKAHVARDGALIALGAAASPYLFARRVRGAEPRWASSATKVAKAAADAQLAQQVAAASRAAAADARWLPATAPLPARVAQPMALARGRRATARCRRATRGDGRVQDGGGHGGRRRGRRAAVAAHAAPGTTADAAWAEASDDRSVGWRSRRRWRAQPSSPSPEPQAAGAAAASDGRDGSSSADELIRRTNTMGRTISCQGARSAAAWRLARLCKAGGGGDRRRPKEAAGR